jgi:hypothetical protein
MNWYKVAVSDSYINSVIEHYETPNDLPFNDMFGDENFRVVIPMANKQLTEIVEKLKDGKTKSGTQYEVDVDNKIAYKWVFNENKEIVKDPRALRLGKVIRKELGKEYADRWSTQVASGNMFDPTNSIVISRHPIDVLRMSDHSGIRSCHSEGSSYFQCAVTEAKEGGPVAYAVETKELEKVNLQDDEIFHDSDRGQAGGVIVPLGRIRLRRYINNDDSEFELAIPETSSYGDNISGFLSSLTEWAYEKQKSKFEGKEINVDDFGFTGGSYKDTADGDLFNNFFDVDNHSGVADYVGEGEAQAMADVWQEELDGFLERNSELKYSSVWAEVEDYGDQPYISSSGSLYFEFSGIGMDSEDIVREKQEAQKRKWAEEDARGVKEDWRNEYDHWKFIREIQSAIENDLSLYMNVEDMDFEESGDTLSIRLSLSSDSIDGPDDVDYMITQLAEYEANNYEKDYADIRNTLVEIGLLNPHVLDVQAERFLNYNFNNFNFEEDNDVAGYTLKSLPIIHSREYMTKNDITNKKILEEMYNVMSQSAMELHNSVAADSYLFPEFAQNVDASQIPKPEIEVVKKYDPAYSEDTFNFYISFRIHPLTIDTDHVGLFFEYISTFDKNFNSIVNSVTSQMNSIVSRVNPPIEEAPVTPETPIAKNWYKTIKMV